VFGHPAHAALSAFPLALLSVSIVGDGLALLEGGTFWWSASFWAVATGFCAALPTACAGLIDFAAIESGQPAAKTAMTHMLLMLTAVCFFGMDLLVRGGTAPPQVPEQVGTVVVDAVATVILLIGGWYGGELVFRHGIGRTVGKGETHD
jgi:uncharacterized membrane protein